MGTCREDFSIRSVLLRNLGEDAFYTSPWTGTRVPFLMYRLTVASFCLGFLIWFISRYAADENFFFHATNYGYFVLTIYFVWAAVVAFVGFSLGRSSVEPTNADRHEESNVGVGFSRGRSSVEPTNADRHEESNVGVGFSRGRSSVEPMNTGRHEEIATLNRKLQWFHQAQWVLMNMVYSPAIIITIAYAAFLSDGQYTFAGVTIHILNTVFVLVEVFVCSVPVRVLHVIYPMLLYLAYIVLVAVNWAVTDRVVYWFLDFSTPGVSSAFVLGFLLVAVPLCHLLVYGLYLLRCRLLHALPGGKIPAPAGNGTAGGPL